MLNVPYCTTQGVSRIVSSDGQAVKWRRKGRREGLVRLRVFQWLNEREVSRNFLCGRRLAQEVAVEFRRLCVSVGGLGQGPIINRRRSRRSRSIEILRQGASQINDRTGCVDGNSGEQWEILAAMSVGGEMRDRRVGQEDQG